MSETLVNKLDKLVEDSNIYNKEQAMTQKEINQKQPVILDVLKQQSTITHETTTEMDFYPTIESEFAKVILEGNSVQDGEPDVNNEIPYQCAIASQSIVSHNRNLIDKNSKDVVLRYTIIENVVQSSYYDCYEDKFIKVKSNTQYSTNKTNVYINEYDKDFNYITYANINYNSQYITDENTAYIKWSTSISNLESIMLIEGTNARQVEYSNGPYMQVNIHLKNLELFELDGVRDKIYLQGNKWFYESKIQKRILTSNDIPRNQPVGPDNRGRYSYMISNSTGYDNIRKSNFFFNDSSKQDFISARGATYIYTDKLINRDAFIDFIEQNEVYYIAKRQTPIITEITDQDIINDLNKLYEVLKSTKYTTKVIVVSNGVPLNIIVTAYASNTKRFEDIESRLALLE